MSFPYDVYVLEGGKSRHVKADRLEALNLIDFYQRLNQMNAQVAMFPHDTGRPRWVYVAKS